MDYSIKQGTLGKKVYNHRWDSQLAELDSELAACRSRLKTDYTFSQYDSQKP